MYKNSHLRGDSFKLVESLNPGWVGDRRQAGVPIPVQNAKRDLNLPRRAPCAFGGGLHTQTSFLRGRKASEKC